MDRCIDPARIPSADNAVGGKIIEHPSWSPYDNNGGSTLAIAGADYVVVAASTRLSTGFSVLTRNTTLLKQLSPSCVIAGSGFRGDQTALFKQLEWRANSYQHTHNRPIGCPAAAQLLSYELYMRRMFPYYCFALCAGFTNDGEPCVYTYDAIGTIEKVGVMCAGSGEPFMYPLLDRELKARNPMALSDEPMVAHVPLEKALDVAKAAFVYAAERDIYTGDAVEIWVLKKDGVKKELLELKKD